MNTIGWLMVLIAGLIIRGVASGRSITEQPKDLGDALVALLSGDTAAVNAALHRTGATNDAAVIVAGEPVTATGGKGSDLLSEMKRLGAASSGRYRWGATGPEYYDCSGMVWRALKNLGVYTGARFTTASFPMVSKGFAVKVPAGEVGDIVLWPGHMAVVSRAGYCYGAQSTKTGIKESPLTAHKGTPRYYRVQANVRATDREAAMGNGGA